MSVVWVVTAHLVLLKVSAHPPALVISQCVPVLLEQCIYTRNTTIPRVLQILKRQSSVLGCSLLPLQPILCPHSLAVNELTLPWLNIADG